MPFTDEAGIPVITVDLRQVGPKAFQLMQGFTYTEPGGQTYEIPGHDLAKPNGRGQTTDLASVPPLLWGLVASYGQHTRAGLFHDRLCQLARREPTPQERRKARREADRLFRVALIESDVPWLRCWLMWAAVSFGRYLELARPLGWLMAAQLLAAVGWIWFAPIRFDGLPLVVALAVPALASLLWWRDAGVVALGSYASVVVVPVLIVGALAALTWWVPSALHWVITDRARLTFPTPAPYKVQPKAF